MKIFKKRKKRELKRKGQATIFYEYLEKMLRTHKGFTASFEDDYQKVEFATEKSPKRTTKKVEE